MNNTNVIPTLGDRPKRFNLDEMVSYIISNPDEACVIAIISLAVIIYAICQQSSSLAIITSVGVWLISSLVVEKLVDVEHQEHAANELTVVLQSKPTNYLKQYRESPEVSFRARLIATQILNEERAGWSIDVE